jgi:hypothetical protein
MSYLLKHFIVLSVYTESNAIELDELMKRRNVINYVKAQRLSWFGHTNRMPETSIVKKIYKWNVQLVKLYSVVNTTDYSFIASRYSIDVKLHVSAIWWPSTGFIQVCEEKTCYFTFPLVLRSQTVLVVGTA